MCEPPFEEDGFYLVRGPRGAGPEPLGRFRYRWGGLGLDLGLGQQTMTGSPCCMRWEGAQRSLGQSGAGEGNGLKIENMSCAQWDWRLDSWLWEWPRHRDGTLGVSVGLPRPGE